MNLLKCFKTFKQLVLIDFLAVDRKHILLLKLVPRTKVFWFFMDNPQKINGDFKGKDIVSLDQFSKKDIYILFSNTSKMKNLVQKKGGSTLLKGKIMCAIFYEPSSRTFGSFITSMQRLGGGFIPLQGMGNSSVAKGETLEDTMQTFSSYSDVIVIRHPERGTAKIAANATEIPVINAGDGIGEHPTQALLDLYTIQEEFGKLDNLTGVFAGDMLHGRTVKSLLRGLSLFKNNTCYLLSPKELKLSREDFNDFQRRGIKIIEIKNYSDIPKNAHFWYWTRIQKERFENFKDYEKVKNIFILTKRLLDTYGNSKMILMHPLPRVNEIEKEIDSDTRAVYLKRQMKNGMYLRMALLALVLGKI
ncbi:MAG: aspartate carbamoyltransferase [Candidatus Levybacteria bacterium]|nr:aspartate carbamoyltransferase [Candidatus Levybacteria bacterium]